MRPDALLLDHREHPSPEAHAGVMRVAVPLLLFVPIVALGNAMGLVWRYPEVGAAVLYPPYAALTAALLTSRRRDWIWFILASVVAHVATFWSSFPLSFVLLADVANVARATVAAVLLRSLFGGPLRLDSVWAVILFLVTAVMVAPAVGATIGAADVMLHGASDSFWRPWRAWFVSNALTGLTMLPAVIVLFEYGAGMRPFRFERKRVAEALLLAIATCLSCLVAFLGDYGGQGRALVLYAPLPALIWAALRFGPAGASLALTVVTYAAIGGVDRGTAPFLSSSRDHDVMTLQTFVLLTAAPVLCFAAVAAQRQAAQTALRLSHGRLEDLAGRLITAQEAERARIARDLHDDVGQRVASFSIALSRLRQQIPDGSAPADPSLSDLQAQVMRLSDDLRLLSHDLHPTILEHVGLLQAIRARCDEFGKENGVSVRFEVSDGWRDVTDAVGLCLYRVAQEALRNVGAHARAQNVTVSLDRRNRHLEMHVTDDGRGFDPAGVAGRSGLGLVSLRERVRSLGGVLDVAASPGAGTRIEVRLPIGESDATQSSPR